MPFLDTLVILEPERALCTTLSENLPTLTSIYIETAHTALLLCIVC